LEAPTHRGMGRVHRSIWEIKEGGNKERGSRGGRIVSQYQPMSFIHFVGVVKGKFQGGGGVRGGRVGGSSKGVLLKWRKDGQGTKNISQKQKKVYLNAGTFSDFRENVGAGANEKVEWGPKNVAKRRAKTGTG